MTQKNPSINPWRIVGVADGTKLTWKVPEGSPGASSGNDVRGREPRFTGAVCPRTGEPRAFLDEPEY